MRRSVLSGTCLAICVTLVPTVGAPPSDVSSAAGDATIAFGGHEDDDGGDGRGYLKFNIEQAVKIQQNEVRVKRNREESLFIHKDA